MIVIDAEGKPLSSALMNTCKVKCGEGGTIWMSEKAFNFVASQGYAVRQYKVSPRYWIKAQFRRLRERLGRPVPDERADGSWTFRLDTHYPEDVIVVRCADETLICGNFVTANA